MSNKEEMRRARRVRDRIIKALLEIESIDPLDVIPQAERSLGLADRHLQTAFAQVNKLLKKSE